MTSLAHHHQGPQGRPAVQPGGISLLQIHTPVAHGMAKVIVPIGAMDGIALVEELGVRHTRQVVVWPRHGDAGELGIGVEPPSRRRVASGAGTDHHRPHLFIPLPGEGTLSAQDDLTEAETWYGRKVQLEEDLAQRTTEITAAKTLYNTFLGTPPNGTPSDAAWIIKQIEDFITDYDSSGSGVDTEKDALEAAKNAFASQRQTAKTVDVDSTITQGETNHSNMEANVNTYNPITTADVTTAENAVTSAQTAKVTADADVTAKYAALEAAYEAVKAVCPDWTPDEPLPPEPVA